MRRIPSENRSATTGRRTVRALLATTALVGIVAACADPLNPQPLPPINEGEPSGSLQPDGGTQLSSDAAAPAPNTDDGGTRGADASEPTDASDADTSDADTSDAGDAGEDADAGPT